VKELSDKEYRNLLKAKEELRLIKIKRNAYYERVKNTTQYKYAII